MRKDPRRLLDAPREDFQALGYGWGNESFSASAEFLSECMTAAAVPGGPILECGSGLSTLLVGMIAATAGREVWSLEHDPEWAERVHRELRRLRLVGSHIHCAALRDYGEFSWYAPPLAQMPATFDLVVCDGPPGTTRGGRSGLLPIMKQKLAPGCRILLDDASRDGERAVASFWASELGTRPVLRGNSPPFVEFVVPITEVRDSDLPGGAGQGAHPVRAL
jgi:methyltransferase family protein